MFALFPFFSFGKNKTEQRKNSTPESYRSYSAPVLSPVAAVIAADLRKGREFSIQTKRNLGKVFTVLNITPTGFQYGIKENGKFQITSFMAFEDCGNIAFVDEAVKSAPYVMPAANPKLSPVANSLASEIRIGRKFAIQTKRNRNKVFTVLNITANGFQYGIKVNGKVVDHYFMHFDECDNIAFVEKVTEDASHIGMTDDDLEVTSIANEVRLGREFTIGSPRQKGKTFTVLHVAPHGFQYGIKSGDQNTEIGYRDFKDAKDITFKSASLISFQK